MVCSWSSFQRGSLWNVGVSNTLTSVWWSLCIRTCQLDCHEDIVIPSLPLNTEYSEHFEIMYEYWMLPVSHG